MKDPRTGESKTSERRVAAVDKQLQALELRKAGVGYVQIAQQVGYKGPSGAYKAVMTAIKKTLQEPSREVVKLELERLDRMLFAVWQEAVQGDHQAVDRVLKIMDKRFQLLGLDRVGERCFMESNGLDAESLTATDPTKLVAGIVGLFLSGKIDSKSASVLASLSNVLIRAKELQEMEQRVASLESAVQQSPQVEMLIERTDQSYFFVPDDSCQSVSGND